MPPEGGYSADMSRATSFFEKIGTSADPVAFLRQLVTDKMAETEYLEFKAGRMDESGVKRYWSQALSGFANTEGGVLIFGIKTDPIPPAPGDRRIDTATGLDLVQKPDQLVQLLKDTLLNSTVEPVRGVEYLSVKEPSGEGFVVCLVPEGKSKPYRAESDQSRNYFQRVGDSFVILSHPLLRSLFYPQNTAVVRPHVRVHRPNPTFIQLNGSFQNTGERTVSNMGALIQTAQKYEWIAHDGQFRQTSTAAHRPGMQMLQVSAQTPLHPGEHSPAFTLLVNDDSIKSDNIEIGITLYLDNQAPSFYKAFISSPFDTGKEAVIEQVEKL